MGDGMIRRP